MLLVVIIYIWVCPVNLCSILSQNYFVKFLYVLPSSYTFRRWFWVSRFSPSSSYTFCQVPIRSALLFDFWCFSEKFLYVLRSSYTFRPAFWFLPPPLKFLYVPPCFFKTRTLSSMKFLWSSYAFRPAFNHNLWLWLLCMKFLCVPPCFLTQSIVFNIFWTLAMKFLCVPPCFLKNIVFWWNLTK